MSKIHCIRPALQAASIATLAALTLAATAAQAGDRAKAPNQTASGIWVASGDVNGDGRPDAATRGKLEQNGTTVGTAAEVQAPNTTKGPHLLLPAVQKYQDGKPATAQRAKLKQNGTTVATAGEVQAPGAKPRAGLLLPAVQKVRMQPQAQRSQFRQNGTTVRTAGDIMARRRN
jgi:hypothetical protein